MTGPIWFGSDRFRAHGDIDALALSADGALLALGSGIGDDTSVWQVATGALLGRAPLSADSLVFDGADTLWVGFAHTHRWQFRSAPPDLFMLEVGSPIALSPDGALLVGSRPPGGRQEIVLCDVTRRAVVWAVPAATPQVRSIAFSSDGRHVVVADGDAARVLDVRDGHVHALVRPLEGGVAVIAAVAGPAVVAVAVGGKRFDLPSGQRVTLPFDIDALALSPDGRVAALAGGRHELAIVDATTAVVRKLPPGSTGLRGVLATDGRRVATATWQLARLFDLSANEWLDRIDGHHDELSAVAVSPDGELLATAGGFDGMVRLWRVRDGEAAGVLEGHQNLILSMAFSPDGRLLATGCADQATRIFDTGSCTLRAAHGGDADVSGVVWLRAHRLVTIMRDGAVVLRSTVDARVVRTIGTAGARSYLGTSPALAAPAHGGWLAASGSRGELVAFDGDTLDPIMEREHMGEILAAAPYAPWVVLRDGGATTLVEVPSGTIVHRWEELGAIAAAFDRDGRLALLPWDAPAQVCEPTRPETHVRVTIGGPAARCLSFSPDGRLAHGLVDGRAVLVEVPLSPTERRTRAMTQRLEQARELLEGLGAVHAGSGYRTAPPRAHAEGSRVRIRIDGALVVATVVTEQTTELRITVDKELVVTAEPVETFANRMTRWIRRRLGRPEARDDRGHDPWLAALPAADRARSIHTVREPGHLTVVLDLDELPTREILLEWIMRCRAAPA